MLRVFTEKYYLTDLNTLRKKKNLFQIRVICLFPLQLIIYLKRQQYITNATANQFLSISQATFFVRNIEKIGHFQGKAAFFRLRFFFFFFQSNFPCIFFMATEILEKKESFFANVVKINSQNNCIKSFPFSRYKEN